MSPDLEAPHILDGSMIHSPKLYTQVKHVDCSARLQKDFADDFRSSFLVGIATWQSGIGFSMLSSGVR